jgi:UDP-glucose 4-epimerase
MPVAIVTGGAGFIGSNIVSALLNREYTVHVFDNLSTGCLWNLDTMNPRLRFYRLDLKSEISKWPELTADVLYHFAANADVRGGVNDRDTDIAENILVTKSVADYCRSNKILHIVFASSAAVYGEPEIYPTPETVLGNQTSIYGASKLGAEALLQAYSNYGDFRTSIFRFVSWIGKGYSHGVIYDFVKKLKDDPHNLYVLGDGSQVKSYLDVEDGVKGVLLLSQSQTSNSEIFNLGHVENMTVSDLAYAVIKKLSLVDVTLKFSGGSRGWIGDSPRVVLDITKAMAYGWHPSVPIQEGINRTVEYLTTGNNKLYR